MKNPFFPGYYHSQLGHGWPSDIGSLSNDIANKLRRHRCPCECWVDCWIRAEAREFRGAPRWAEDGAVTRLPSVRQVSPKQMMLVMGFNEIFFLCGFSTPPVVKSFTIIDIPFPEAVYVKPSVASYPSSLKRFWYDLIRFIVVVVGLLARNFYHHVNCHNPRAFQCKDLNLNAQFNNFPPQGEILMCDIARG